MTTTTASPSGDRPRTQRDQILAHLEQGRPITPMQALRLYGCARLGARIHELREDGYPITRELVHVPTRAGGRTRVARYSL